MTKDEANKQLIKAAWDGKLGSARAALLAGADVNTRDKSQHTPLHRASIYRNVAVARLLIENGADINSRDDVRWTPLHIAARMGDTEMVRLLLEKGADVNAKTGDQQTPLGLAQRYGQDAEELLADALLQQRNSHADRIDKQRVKSGGPEVGG